MLLIVAEGMSLETGFLHHWSLPDCSCRTVRPLKEFMEKKNSPAESALVFIRTRS